MTSSERLHEAMEIDNLELAKSLLATKPELVNARLPIRAGTQNRRINQRAIAYAGSYVR